MQVMVLRPWGRDFTRLVEPHRQMLTIRGDKIPIHVQSQVWVMGKI